MLKKNPKIQFLKQLGLDLYGKVCTLGGKAWNEFGFGQVRPDRDGSVCLNRFLWFLGGGSVLVRLPWSLAAG
jgi:hypothetical protein